MTEAGYAMPATALMKNGPLGWDGCASTRRKPCGMRSSISLRRGANGRSCPRASRPSPRCNIISTGCATTACDAVSSGPRGWAPGHASGTRSCRFLETSFRPSGGLVLLGIQVSRPCLDPAGGDIAVRQIIGNDQVTDPGPRVGKRTLPGVSTARRQVWYRRSAGRHGRQHRHDLNDNLECREVDKAGLTETVRGQVHPCR